MKPTAINNFDSINEIYDQFNTVTNKIRLEDQEYEYQKMTVKGDVKKHIYRCDQEQHNLVISTLGNVVVNVEGIYSIGKVAV
ncbi:hypothetical protein [Lysinibacillus sp. SGAir0095]|uniref:hypothetical protein n=1 Tax=Lysinibacillus sp. SGAir0095 TaxID=2070463 RepID=UPI0010CCFCB8|nr:hypothetical protein [Lysinibacillus sp. SGAir0095]QCR33149.1 hypothetical protein C1N55_13585 [Lysinibacillus sp. SGAir0095]